MHAVYPFKGTSGKDPYRLTLIDDEIYNKYKFKI